MGFPIVFKIFQKQRDYQHLPFNHDIKHTVSLPPYSSSRAYHKNITPRLKNLNLKTCTTQNNHWQELDWERTHELQIRKISQKQIIKITLIEWLTRRQTSVTTNDIHELTRTQKIGLIYRDRQAWYNIWQGPKTLAMLDWILFGRVQKQHSTPNHVVAYEMIQINLRYIHTTTDYQKPSN